ncbi:MAG: T9SS type A sorting domain-containing protein, partial [Melioribacteraceae bacterium]|nr:T9SS type A sorting domain-containing protein [Melioribacteraceae bacterium]
SQITFAFDPIDSTTIYVAGDDQMAHTAFYPSYDLGESWYFLPNSISTNWIIVDWANNNRIYLFAYPMRSEDGGQTWMYIVDGLPMTSRIFSIINPHDSSVLYTSTKEGIYKTTNRGEQWELIEGSENLNFQFSINYPEHLFIDSFTNKLYVGTKQGLYKYDLITSVEEEKENIPGEFILHQNYPNPFNPTTTIKYQITNDKSQINSSPQDAAHNTKIQTLLVVYDILGKEVATLVNEEQSPGSYIVTFTASNLPSGIYLYRLTAGQVSIVRKMLLLK